mgnify:CR=1 FL=1
MYCRKCGKELEEDWKICPNCGTPIYDSGEEKDNIKGQAEAEKRPDRKIWKKWQFWMFITLFVVIISAIAIIVMGNKENQDSNSVSAQTNEVNQEEPEKELVTDFSDQDFSELLNKTEADIESIGLTEENDTGSYTGLEGNIRITFKEEQISEIIITGDKKTAPAFHGIVLGNTGEEVNSKLSEIYPESQDFPDGIRRLNLDTKEGLECTLTDGKVSEIHYMRLSDEEVEAVKATKEEQLRAEFIFPDSDKKYLSEDEIRSKNVDEMIIGRNEIFARHGYIFGEDGLKQHFEGTSWYKGTVPAEQFNSEQIFNDFEKKNVELIKQVEDEINGVAQAEAEQQNAINEGYDFIAGHSYNLRDWQLVIEFQSSDTVRICYGGEIQDDYFNYSITARYEENKDEMSWLKYITINGVEYYLRCFNDGSINLSGPGEFDGWYDEV